MDALRLPTVAISCFSTTGTCSKEKIVKCNNSRERMSFEVLCYPSKKRGFGPESTKKKTGGKTPKERTSEASETRKFSPAKPTSGTGQAPGLNTGFEDRSGNVVSDRQFMEKLEEIKRSARARKQVAANNSTGAIDYDAPIKTENTIGFGTKVGVGIAVVVFGTVFAFGDFLPYQSINRKDTEVVETKLTDEEKSTLQSRLQQFEAKLDESPNDLSAVEGAAVTLAELGDFKKASILLENLTKEKPEDSEAYRLLGEVKFQLKDYDGSAESYRNAFAGSQMTSFESLRGLTNALLAAKKPDEAVRMLLSYTKDRAKASQTGAGVSEDPKEENNIDPIQVQMLLGKAYSDWGHVSDAVAVYDELISEHPKDFRGYLAKGIILKENGKTGDAERMFIQARFLAPDRAKTLVDQYARR